MQDIIDDNEITHSVLPEFAVTMEIQSEQELSNEIASLWSAHVNAKNTARATNQDLRKIRAKLGEHLYRMKDILAKPGRDGQWSGFLRDSNIPRATADRLVARHQQSLNPDSNCVSEAIMEPTKAEIIKFFNSISPRLRRFLKTPNAVFNFIAMLTVYYRCGEVTDRGILVLKPALPTMSASSDGGSTTEPELGSALVPRMAEEVI
jgi:hypothetical protein